MQLSQQRIGELARGYLSHLHRRPSNRSAAPPHAFTPADLRKLETWLALFSMNAGMQERLVSYVRDKGRARRRQRMRRAYEGYVNGVDAVSNERLLVCFGAIDNGSP